MKCPKGLLIALVITIILFITFLLISTITTSENIKLMHGINSSFSKNDFIDLNYKYKILGSKFPLIRGGKEYYINAAKPFKDPLTPIQTYHENFDDRINAPTIINWYSKSTIDKSKPLVVMVTIKAFLMYSLKFVQDEIKDIINKDPENEYIIASIEKPHLNGSKISQMEEIQMFDDAISVYKLIDIVTEKYPDATIMLYAYSLGATTVYEYLQKFDDSQGVKLAILNSPLLDLQKYFYSTRYSVRIFNVLTIAYIKKLLKQYKHVFKTDDEKSIYSEVMAPSISFQNMVMSWLKYKNKEISIIDDIKDTNVPVVLIAANNDPIVKYDQSLLSNYCKNLDNLTCILFDSGGHINFKDANDIRMTPRIIHNMVNSTLNKMRTDVKNRTNEIVNDMNSDGINDIDKINEIVDVPDP
jgi:predicted alpha/beta hydrolase family esterase